jgi:hypothetical protein
VRAGSATVLRHAARPHQVPKPEALQARGGIWFSLGAQQLRVGVESGFSPAKKAHPALKVAPQRLDALADRLQLAGSAVRWDDALTDVRRFYTSEVWGNRLELLSAD